MGEFFFFFLYSSHQNLVFCARLFFFFFWQLTVLTMSGTKRSNKVIEFNFIYSVVSSCCCKGLLYIFMFPRRY